MSVPFAKPLALTRFAAGVYQDGTWETGADSEVTVRACVQPLGTREADQKMVNRLGLESLDGLVRIHSESALQATDKSAGLEGDQFTWQGQLYEVIEQQYWPLPKEHWKGIGRIVDSNTGYAPPEPEPVP